MTSRRQDRKNAKQALRRSFSSPFATATLVRSIQQQIDDLKPDVDATFQLMWEEIAADRISVERAARRMRVTYIDAADEIDAAKGRLRHAAVLASRGYPINSFKEHGLAGVPRREYVPELAELVGV